MRHFDPEKQLAILHDSCGYALDLESSFDEAKAEGGLGSSAHAFLGTAIYCQLVGLHDQALQLLEKTKQWVTAAISGKERPPRYFPDGTEALWFQTLAMCNWLLDGKHDAEALRQYVDHQDRYLASSRAGKDKASVSLTLPTYLDAREYQRAIIIYTNSGLLPPTSLKSLRSEAQMSYVICQHRLNKVYSDAEVAEATSRFLTKNMNKWLADGHALCAAEWIKVVYGSDADIEPSSRQLLMKCYEHLVGEWGIPMPDSQQLPVNPTFVPRTGKLFP